MTTSLMAFVGGVTVAALSGGLSVWERAAAYGVQQESSSVAFERLRRDVRNAAIFTPVPFEGVYNQCSFAGVDREPGGGEALPELGRIGYFLDERRGWLCRSFVPYRLMKRYRLTERCEPILEGVARIRLRYYGADSPGGTPEWHPRWAAPYPPLAVQAECQVALTARETETRTLLIDLPVRPAPAASSTEAL